MRRRRPRVIVDYGVSFEQRDRVAVLRESEC